MRRLLWMAVCAALGGLSACSPTERTGSPRSVVVIVIDTLRPDALESFGAQPGSAPALRGLAERGTVFEDVFAVAPWTGPAVAGLLTGRYPDEVGVHGLRDALPASVTTLAQRFQAAGYATGSVVSNSMAGPTYGHGKGYEFVHFERYKEKRGAPPAFRAEGVVDAALPWLDQQLEDGARPFFLYLHTCDPHEPYLAQEPWRAEFTAGHEALDDAWLLARGYLQAIPEPGVVESLRAHYRAEVAAADDALGRLLERLPEDVVVAVISDHGEEFLEHARFLHGHTLYQEMLHVPWTLAGPGVPVGRVGYPVSQVDLAPTLLELAGVPFDQREFSGRSLVGELAGEQRAEDEPPRALHAVLEDAPRHSLALRRGRWKLIHRVTHGTTHLFDLESDPRERVDVADRHPQVAAELLALLLARQQAIRPIATDEDPELAAQREAELRALGYAR